MLDLRPEFFDVFGLLTFSFIFLVAYRSLSTGKRLPKWVLTVLLFIGALGLIIDGTLVYSFFERL